MPPWWDNEEHVRRMISRAVMWGLVRWTGLVLLAFFIACVVVYLFGVAVGIFPKPAIHL